MLEKVLLLLSEQQKLSKQNLTLGRLAQRLSSEPRLIEDAIAELKYRGVVIEEHSSGQLSLSEFSPLLSEQGMEKVLNRALLERIVLDCRFEVESTNQLLLDAPLHSDKLTICTSEWQSQGRGRQGRAWISPLGKNLMFSMARKWQQDSILVNAGLLNILSLIAGVAVASTLKGLGLSEVKLKWPNDIVMVSDDAQLEKMGGILVEMKGNSKQGVWVSGIGLNIADDRSWHHQVDQQITSLGQIVNREFSRELILAGIIQRWLELEELLLTAGTEALIEQWREYDVLLNKRVTIYPNHEQPYEGIARGIDEQGQLLIEVKQQLADRAMPKLLSIHSGEVKVRMSHATAY